MPALMAGRRRFVPFTVAMARFNRRAALTARVAHRVTKGRWSRAAGIREALLRRLSPHMLDAAAGVPGAGMGLVRCNVPGGVISRAATYADGRCEGLLQEVASRLEGGCLRVFAAAERFRFPRLTLPNRPFSM